MWVARADLRSKGQTVRRSLVGSFRIHLPALVLAVLISPPTASLAAVTIETVALEGDLPLGVEIQRVRAPRIDPLGRVVFVSTPCVAPGFFTECIWSWDDGQFTQLAQAGQSPPGIAPALFDRIVSYDESLYATEHGVSFQAQLAGPGVTSSNDEALFGAAASGDLQLLAREGGAVPGTSLVYRSLFSGAAVAGAQHTCMVGTGDLGPPTFGSDDVIHCQDPSGALALVLREGDLVPGSATSSWEDLELEAVNGSGDILIDAAFGDGVSSHFGLQVVDANGAVHEVARLGAAAPGGDTFAGPFFFEIGLNDARETAFVTTLESTVRGVWGPAGNGGLRRVALANDAAPGTGDTFGTFFRVALDGDGRTLFTASLGSGVPGDSGLWSAPPGGSAALLLRAGDLIPGLGGARWTGVSSFEANAAGGLLVEVGLDTGNNESLWHFDLASGSRELLVREGDQIEVATGDVRTIGDTNNANAIRVAGQISGGQDGRGRGWNDSGQAAVILSFTDDSEGIFRITLPEPATSGVITAFAMLVALRRGRRSRRL